jgi:hypothetical protein
MRVVLPDLTDAKQSCRELSCMFLQAIEVERLVQLRLRCSLVCTRRVYASWVVHLEKEGVLFVASRF